MGFNLKEEIRGDYLISSKVKKLWAVELSILEELERVCKKYNLTYYADGGTLLGAVRNKGFIPWDNDIDIQMMAEDYEILCQISQSEFKDPFFFQYYKSEEGFLPWHAKLRRSDTTGIVEWEGKYHPTWNHGIFIDIFPLYGVPDDNRLFQAQCLRIKHLGNILSGYGKWHTQITTEQSKYKPWETQLVMYKLCRSFTTPEKLSAKYLKICSEAGNKTKRVGVSSFRPGDPSLIWDRDMFAETIELPFEDRSIPCPKQYDARLKIQYGDYMVEKRGTERHGSLIFDADVPYKQFMSTREIV